MRRETQHVLLVLLGGALLRIAADDTYLRYVRPAHRPLLLAAGAVIVVLAVVALLRDGRRAAPSDDPHPTPADEPHPARAGGRGLTPPDHQHGAADRHVPWLLLVPVLAIALVAPPALGADAVSRAGTRNAALTSADLFGPLPAGDAPAVPLAELIGRAIAGTSGGLDGREVTLTGFVVRQGGTVELVRMTIACCAADGHPNRVRLSGDLGELASDTWLRMRGTVQPGSASAAGGYIPTLTATAIDIIPEPPDPYEY